jgi:AcrR family transcriptional regulator
MKEHSRPYRMKRRAEAFASTRNQIVWATMQLHAEKGAAATSQADIAARAGVSPATVYRHFPTLGSLVRACGSQIWMAVSPPRPEDAERLFAGLGTTSQRLDKFVEEVSAFYGRAWLPLQSARQERSRVPELDEDMRWIEAGLEALAREALTLEGAGEDRVQVLLAVTDFGVWQSLRDHGIAADAAPKMLLDLVRCAAHSTLRQRSI